MSTPPDPEQAPRRSALEPTHVLRRRRPGALSELVRQVQERERERDLQDGYEVVAVASPGTAVPPRAEDDTQELPPVVDDTTGTRERPATGSPAHGSPSPILRRAALAVAAVAAALAGFTAALLLTWGGDEGERQDRTPAAPTAAAPERPADPDGPGTLREGDSGPAVSDLQERLLRIPNVYEGGTPSGVYDATLTAAVARFQLWYGIRGDETGVYGNDTRSDLEARTGSPEPSSPPVAAEAAPGPGAPGAGPKAGPAGRHEAKSSAENGP
ncbi:peptidoglycan-binding protein [Streptomyces fructofermentans]|uniref:peptidoglycan-binding protein n=1 Tax=Streptomyces fructofermentans TaxID=152141 RepID=UPI0037A2EDB3